MARQTIKLADVLVLQPKSKFKAGDGKDAGQYKFFTSSAVQNKFMDVYLYDRPALIFGTGGNANVHFCNEPFSTSTDCLVFFADEELILKTIYYYLSWRIEILEKGFRGTGLKHISRQYILDIAFSAPDVKDQQKLAALLPKIESLIALRKQQAKMLDVLARARFAEMFGDPVLNPKGWAVARLGDLFAVGSSKRIYQSEWTREGVPFLRVADLLQRAENEAKIENYKLHISEDRYKELKDSGLVPSAGDILVTSRGTLGKCYEVKARDKFYFQDGMISWLYNRNPKIGVAYFIQLFQMHGFRKQIDDAPVGSTVSYLSLDRLKKMLVMCPPIEMQEDFAIFAEKATKVKAAIRNSIELLQTLKKVLMQKYFWINRATD